MNKLTRKVTIGLISAMPEELGTTLINLKKLKKKNYGTLEIYSGFWEDHGMSDLEIKIITAWSGWGKVSSSHTVTRLICESEQQDSKLDLIIFTGVAGAADEFLKQWDIVIANSYIQHDMDASPLYPKYYIPILNTDFIKTNTRLKTWALNSLQNDLKKESKDTFGKINCGLIATGDKFISDKKDMKKLLSAFPDLKAVEMEGGAVSQVLIRERIPFLAVRVISDQADDQAGQSFQSFIKEYDMKSWLLVKTLLLNIEKLIV